jgi:hypothetical protein
MYVYQQLFIQLYACGYGISSKNDIRNNSPYRLADSQLLLASARGKILKIE